MDILDSNGRLGLSIDNRETKIKVEISINDLLFGMNTSYSIRHLTLSASFFDWSKRGGDSTTPNL